MRPGLSPAVFLDRDGVLNEVVQRGPTVASPRSLSELRLCPGAAAAVARLRRSGLPVFVVSNQPDVARGLLAANELDSLTAAIRAEVVVDDWRYCVHDDADGCECRKPRPGLLLALAREWGIDLGTSYLVGDSAKDMAAGAAAGCRTILLRRDYNADAKGGDEVRTLGEAVDLVLERSGVSYARAYLDDAARVLAGVDAAALESMAAALARLREEGGRLFFLGVGGGAAHASHAVCDFRKIAGIEAYAATDNVAELSARVFGVVGRDGGFTARVADHCVVVPTVNPGTVTAHTESMQALIWHLLVSHPRLQRHAMKWEAVTPAGS